MAILTKKDLLEAIEDMPMNTPIVVFYAGVYEDVEGIRMNDLYDTKDTNRHSEKCICLYFEESC